MRKAPKIRILICLLAAPALWAVLMEEPSVPAVRSAGDSTAQKKAAPDASPALGAELAARRPLPAMDFDPFAPRSSLPQAPKPAAAPTAARPSAPAMPYRVAGHLRTHSGIQVFLARGDQVFPIRENDLLDGQYRVESLASTQVVLIHLPTNTRETLDFGSHDESRQAASPAAAEPGAGASAPKAPPRGVAFRLEGPPQATEGREFNLVMRMSSSERVFNVPMQLLFDAAVLQPVSVRPGAYFAADEERFRYRITPQGTIYVAASHSAPAATSDAEIAVFTFRPLKASAAAEVRVATLRAEGPDRRTIAHQDVVPFRTAIAP